MASVGNALVDRAEAAVVAVAVDAASASRSARSSADRASWVAAAFSSTRAMRRVPGIGTVDGCWASSQARATSPGGRPSRGPGR